MSTFGLKLEKVVLKSANECEVEINYSSSSSRAVNTSESLEQIQPNHECIHEPLYLLEKFGVSDECYHELAMLHPQLPRSYKVKGARRDISNKIDLLSLPSPFVGAYRPLKEFISLVLSDKVNFT